MLPIEKTKFHIDALTTDSKELLQSLLSEEFLTEHIEKILTDYEFVLFDDKEISTIIFLALNDCNVDFEAIDFIVAKIGSVEAHLLADKVYKIDEEELITYFLTKSTLTPDEYDILKEYHEMVSYDVNYYYITEKIDGGSCRKIMNDFFKSLNPYTRKYLFEYIAFSIREEEMRLKESAHAKQELS